MNGNTKVTRKVSPNLHACKKTIVKTVRNIKPMAPAAKIKPALNTPVLYNRNANLRFITTQNRPSKSLRSKYREFDLKTTQIHVNLTKCRESATISSWLHRS
jgi:hypothetical protein